MKALPIILGGGAVLLVVAAASKAKASTATSTTSTTTGSTTSSTTKPTGSTTSSTTKPTTGAVPVVIVEQILLTHDTDAAQRQKVWLNDNGYPKTAFAITQWLKGDITDAQLRIAAATETVTHATSVTTAKPTGVMTIDSDGQYYLTNGTNDELYDYAIASNSIPLVGQAATRLASAGDSRAMALTQHLANIST